jgi:hypothetical protein
VAVGIELVIVDHPADGALCGDELSAVAERIDAARKREISRTRRGLTVIDGDTEMRSDAI